jgi:hypothetical protein
MPDAFTNYKGGIKPFIPARNTPEIVEVPNKTTQNPTNKWGRSNATNKYSSPLKIRKTINAYKKQVDETRCKLDTQPSSNARIVEEVTSENLRTMDTRNPDMPLRVDELATDYIETDETFECKATVIDSYFSEQVADNLND